MQDDHDDQPGDEGLSEDQEVQQMASGGKGSPKFDLTDSGHAERFVHLIKGQAHYVVEPGCWITWNGKRWEYNDAVALRWTKKVSQDLLEQAVKADKKGNEELSEMLRKAAGKARSARTRQSIANLAQTEEGIQISQETLDRDPWLLGLPGETLDLKTGESRRPKPEDYITKTAGTNTDPTADCPKFKAFMEKIFEGRGEMIDFMQRLMGYSLTGKTSEQVLPIFFGEGANGKGTLVRVMQDLLRDYSTEIRADALLRTKQAGGDCTPDLHLLRGVRFASAQEPDEGAILAEGMVKTLTGEDTITVNPKYQNAYTLVPQFKLAVSTNHKPTIKGQDHALWRRLLLIPFDVTIPKSERDPDLDEKLKRELPGILNFAIEGCLEWQKQGLNPPNIVTGLTNDYRKQMDLVQQFIEAECVIDSETWMLGKDLYGGFRVWITEEQGYRGSPTNQWFTERMKKIGFEKGVREGRVIWKGIKHAPAEAQGAERAKLKVIPGVKSGDGETR